MMACSCLFSWNDSFSKTARNSELIALVKIISFDEFLEREIMGFEGKMPYAMTVEVIKKYKGKESRKRIKILGDNGMLCRPYLAEFKINDLYLIAPASLDATPNTEYEFLSCRTDYLKVNMSTNLAYGKYSLIRDQIEIKTFESKLNYGDWDLVLLGLLVILLILIIIILKKKRQNE
jgi:hypothetical protein